jgi:hypothetical protein
MKTEAEKAMENARKWAAYDDKKLSEEVTARLQQKQGKNPCN